MTVSTKLESQKIAEKIFIHHNFSDTLYVNDIALVKLKDEVELTKFVRTLCLPEKDLAIPGEYGFVAGWGATHVLKTYYSFKKHDKQNNL